MFVGNAMKNQNSWKVEGLIMENCCGGYWKAQVQRWRGCTSTRRALMRRRRWHASMPLFFLLGADSRRFVTNRADSRGNGRYSPISAETGCHHVAGLHSSASWGLVCEREREIRVFASCALTWNYDRECKVESCGVYRFLNRCIGIRENLLKQ